MKRTLLLLLAVYFSLNAHGATKGIQIVGKDGGQAVAYENSYALVIGVSDYKNGWPDLNAVPGELTQVERLLERKGFQVTKIMNPNSDALQDAFEDFVDEYGYEATNRSTSRKRITALKSEQRRAKQLASVVSDSGGSISSSGKACDVCPEMVLIPAGSFRMGDLNGGGYDNEKPVHRVDIKAFALGKTEVTFAEFDVFARATNRVLPENEGWGRGNRPVINVSWDDAKAYVKWLANKTGKRFRLPSESEWEYAVRAGTTTQYSWGNGIGRNNANCEGCGSQWDNKKTAPVGSFKANAFGLNDMHGNVWEWVEDCHEGSYSGAPSDGRARTSGACTYHVLRGGSWYDIPRYLRAANRYRFKPDRRNIHGGFRIAQDL
jgi:formylglycine-generating enzyme required for sulfatase activity